jgi:hypothetical protein
MTLFQSTTGRQNILVSIDLSQSDLENKLWNWLEEKHNEIFWDIEMHEGGNIIIDKDEIIFSGDNGIFTFDAVETETI